MLNNLHLHIFTPWLVPNEKLIVAFVPPWAGKGRRPWVGLRESIPRQGLDRGRTLFPEKVLIYGDQHQNGEGGHP